jgi:hypothetical protein
MWKFIYFIYTKSANYPKPKLVSMYKKFDENRKSQMRVKDCGE